MRVIWDQPEPCPYLPGRTARLPIRAPGRRVLGPELDTLLEQNFRRSGKYFYKAECAGCTECRGLRVPVAEFMPTKTQRRSLAKNDDLDVLAGPPQVTDAHLNLFNRHKLERGLSSSGVPQDADGYRNWLADSAVNTLEIQYVANKRLIAVSILDVGATAVSSVYHYFDPDESRRSLGVFSVLREIEWCQSQGLRWYYLGYYVRDCARLSYKASYFPHEVLTPAGWVRRDRAAE